MQPFDVPTVSVQEISGDALLLDVREPDEWAAGHVDGALHVPMNELPERLATEPGDLTPDEVARLHAAIHDVLTDAVARSVGQQAAKLKGEKRSGLKVHARAELPYPVCGDTVREISFADKSFQYCPTCQTEGRELADRRMSKLLK